MKHLDLFSGIGGFALATEKVWENVEHVFVEIDPFCQEVLKKHWPDSKIYGDIGAFTYASFCDDRRNAGELSPQNEPQTQKRQKERPAEFSGADCILTGGFPCQPFSNAGRKRGKEDYRHLWPEMLRVIREFKPRWIIGENVAGIINMVLDEVCSDLENEGYEVQPFVIPACAINAPHRRDRVWIAANRKSVGSGGGNIDGRSIQKRSVFQAKQKDRNALRNQSKGRITNKFPNEWKQNWLEVATRLCRVDDGIPKRLDRAARLKALGNAIVPQVAEEIMRAIKHADAN